MSNIHRFSIIVLCIFLISCNTETNHKNYEGNANYDLRVENQSNIKIYPVLVDPKSQRKEGFGVVGVGASATKGFGPFKLSNKVIVKWEEGEPNTVYTSEIDSSTLFPIDNKVTRIVFLYKGKRVWLIKAIDRDENVYSKTMPGKFIE